MRPLFHARLTNPPFDDPGVSVDLMFERRGLLLDLGNLYGVPPRRLLRVGHVFVTHAHMDHFSGFDHLLRVCLGRPKELHLFGPSGFADQVGHKLAAYTWNLVHTYAADFTIRVSEIGEDGSVRSARFRTRTSFAREDEGARPARDGVVHAEPAFRVRAAVLDHGIPCLGYAIEETRHINVWRNKVEALGLPVGPWLRDLKRAVLRGEPEDHPIRIAWAEEGGERERTLPLGRLKAEILSEVPGQKIVYVTDVAHHAANAEAIVSLARGADELFIETSFLDADRDIAAARRHLTAAQAGDLARRAGVARLTPFHFSPRYRGREGELRREAEDAFRGGRC